MRLSDAIVCGALLSKLRPGKINHCALGAAADAVGIPRQHPNCHQPLRFYQIAYRWPWILANSELYALTIMDYFDNHVCKGLMTFEAFIQYIKSVEPPCGECCSFDCCCTRVEELEAELSAGSPSLSSSLEPEHTAPFR